MDAQTNQFSQSKMTKPATPTTSATKNLSDEMRKCIDNCTRCHQICEQMIQHCISKGGRHANAEHIRLMRDCADICALSADFMLRGSDMHAQTCGACAAICLACAESCETMNDDEMMQMCVDACRACHESCSKMASQH